MSNPLDIWTEEEKTYLLTEIIKKARIPPGFLYNMIAEHQVSPAFAEIPLPPGRSMKTCQDAFHQMAQEYGHLAQHRHSLPGPTAPPQMSPGERKRPPPPVPLDKQPSGHRAIQPKPAAPGRYSSTDIRTQQQLSPSVDSSFFNEPPRKRGRPSKAEMQRRSMAAQARGETYPSLRKDLPRPGIHPTPLAPGGTESQASVLPSIRQQVPEAAGYGGHMQHPDALGSQTQDIRVHRAPRPPAESSTGAAVGGALNSGPEESTPRTILDNQIAPPPMSLPLSFRGINQSSPIPASPRPQTPLILSKTAGENNGGESTPTTSGAGRENTA
ncbi:hypothetical protein PABG_00278 [Paracoccidioides brasiliensis Pb03]|nr:hypothetical protein PABG_00278 [Paracoccidioides brasiliensis Pb03]